MSVEALARRYAAALADVVIKTGEADVVKNELKVWEEMIAANAELRTVFGNPAIAGGSKSKVLENLIAKAAPARTTANFLRVLLQNKRLINLAQINEKFEIELEERSGSVLAKVTSARELTEAERAELQAGLEKLTGRKVRPAYSIDGAIIGGVVTQIGSTVYDSSVRTQLESLKAELAGA